MKKYSALIVLIFFLFQTVTVYAESATNSLIMLLGVMQSMQADFTQKITDGRGKVLQQANGSMWLKRPGKFRWDVTRPLRQLIIANDTRLWVYDPDLQQVTIRSITREIGSTPALLLSDPNHALESNFNVSYASFDTKTQWFLLKPKDRNSMFAYIKLGFDKQFFIRGMVLQDNLGHVTSIRFNNVVVNAPVSTTLFNFRPPAKVDVIDETRK